MLYLVQLSVSVLGGPFASTLSSPIWIDVEPNTLIGDCVRHIVIVVRVAGVRRIRQFRDLFDDRLCSRGPTNEPPSPRRFARTAAHPNVANGPIMANSTNKSHPMLRAYRPIGIKRPKSLQCCRPSAHSSLGLCLQ
jgi:hypothetical protein